MSKNQKNISHFRMWSRTAFGAVIVLLLQLFAPAISPAHAGTITYTMVRLDRMEVSTATTGTVCAMPATTGTESSVAVTFPAGYTVSTTNATWATSTATTTGWPKSPADGTTSATAWPSIGATATSASGQTVTWSSGDLTVGTWYCFNWTNSAALTVKATPTSDNTGTVATNLDTGNWATASINNDQITVNATAPPTFNFSLGATTSNLGTLSSSTVTSSSSVNATVGTNAFKGWSMWAADQTASPGLTSPTASKTITYSPSAGSSATTLSSGSEGFNLGVGTPTNGGGTGTISVDANYASGGTAFKGGGLDSSLRSIAVSNGTSLNHVVPLTFNAAISTITPAANDYGTTVTVVAAGRF